jgi:hypothetical protein
MRTKVFLFATALLAGLCACAGPSGRGAAVGPTDPHLAGEYTIPTEDEKILDDAIALQRRGDLEQAHELVETLPTNSPARLDKRFDIVTSAWSDERAKVIGKQITKGATFGPIGGGPVLQDDSPEGPKTALQAASFEKIVDKERALLRKRCFKVGSTPTDFKLSVNVDHEGVVRGSSFDHLNGDRAVAECVKAQVLTWKFPASTMGGDFSTTLYFRPGP